MPVPCNDTPKLIPIAGRSKLRTFLEDQGTGYVLKVPCSFRVTLAAGQKVRADHAARLVPAAAWQTASAGHGSKGERDYGWAWLATASARHHLLIRRNLRDHADLAYFLCHVPVGRACSFTTLVRVAGRRWPVEEDFALGKSWFGLADSQVRHYTALTRHLALAMAALAACAITAALARRPNLADHPPLPALVLVAAPAPGQSPMVPPASPAAQASSRSMIRSRSTAPLQPDRPFSGSFRTPSSVSRSTAMARDGTWPAPAAHSRQTGKRSRS